MQKLLLWPQVPFKTNFLTDIFQEFGLDEKHFQYSSYLKLPEHIFCRTILDNCFWTQTRYSRWVSSTNRQSYAWKSWALQHCLGFLIYIQVERRWRRGGGYSFNYVWPFGGHQGLKGQPNGWRAKSRRN